VPRSASCRHQGGLLDRCTGVEDNGRSAMLLASGSRPLAPRCASHPGPDDIMWPMLLFEVAKKHTEVANKQPHAWLRSARAWAGQGATTARDRAAP